MNKFTKLLLLHFFACTLVCVCFFTSCKQQPDHRAPLIVKQEEGEEEENDMYDNPDMLSKLDFEKMKDPALGYVPYDRLKAAIDYTNDMKKNNTPNFLATLLWNERGPIYDSVGPSNGNTRGGNGYTSGRMTAVLVDTLNDPNGNTVIVGGVAGGALTCNKFL